MLNAILSLFLTFLLLPASAQQQRGLKVTTRTPDGATLELYDNSWAVVIGVNQYQHWSRLQYAVNDAQAMRDKLVELGFPPQNIIYLTDAQATKERIELVLGDELRRKLGKNDRVFIYFSGHGQTEDLPGEQQEGYIIPVDGDKSNLFSTCISMTSVRQFSQRMAAKHVFYAIDACYSGLALMKAGELNMRDQQYLQKVARYPARQLVTAGSAGEQVVEQGGHGAFTRTLLIALDGSADKYPPFGVLTGSELGNYLQPTVSLETNNEQTPQFGRLSAGEGEFMFVLPGAAEGGSSQAEVYQGQAAQYDDQIEKLKAQIEAEKRREAEEEAARQEAERKRLEAEKLQRELEALRRQPAPKQEPAQKQEQVVRPSVPIGTREDEMVPVKAGEMVSVSDFGFSIDKYEVTNSQYAEFLNAKGNQSEGGVTWLEIGSSDALIERRGGHFAAKSGYETHPVVRVSWYGAQAYCAWVGKRLPTEEEWQQACQGQGGREYPWGDGIDRTKANYGTDRCCSGDVSDGYDRTAPVGSYPGGASPYGALDMAGNVWEWTASAEGNYRVLRGGSWIAQPSRLRCANRNDNDPDLWSNRYGFRCAR